MTSKIVRDEQGYADLSREELRAALRREIHKNATPVFSHLFRTLARGTLAGTLLIASGCGNGLDGPTIDGSFTPAACNADHVWEAPMREGSVDTPEEAMLTALQAGYDVKCQGPGRAGARAVNDGFVVIATKLTMDCDPVETSSYLLHVTKDGEVTELDSGVIESNDGVCIGRRPDGLIRGTVTEARNAVGAYFANIAQLEASAVLAFEILERELAEHGAPATLLCGARRARLDEIAHSASMAEIARHYGAEPPAPSVLPRPTRSAFEMAMENAKEGCVRETFGAMVGTYQSMAATDPAVRHALRRIAEDETRHAALSWQIAEWLDAHLTAAERAQVRDAMAQAVTALRQEMAEPPNAEVRSIAGLPGPAETAPWIEQLSSLIWATDIAA